MRGRSARAGWTRRAALAALAGAPAVARSDAAFDLDVAIVGAGAAGLAAAAECGRLGLRHAVIEASGRVGGRALTDVSLGAPFDAGAYYLHWAERNPWREEARRLGVALEDDPPGGFRLVRRGEDGGPENVGPRRAQFGRLAALLDGPGVPDVSIAQAAAAAQLSDAASGLSRMALGAEPAQASARDYARLWSGDDLVAPQGFGSLLNRFAKGLHVHLENQVRALRWDGPGVVVETDAGARRARAAIVTVSVGVLKAERVVFAPALPLDTLRSLDGLEMGVMAKVALAFGAERFGMDQRIDILVREGERVVNFDCWTFGRPLAVAHVGGDPARALAASGEREAVAATLDDFVAAVGSKARAALTGGRLHGWADAPFALGAYSHALPGQAGARAGLAAPVGERIWFAGEATAQADGDFGPAMTAGGAFLAGQAAARAVAASVGRRR